MASRSGKDMHYCLNFCLNNPEFSVFLLCLTHKSNENKAWTTMSGTTMCLFYDPKKEEYMVSQIRRKLCLATRTMTSHNTK